MLLGVTCVLGEPSFRKKRSCYGAGASWLDEMGNMERLFMGVIGWDE